MTKVAPGAHVANIDFHLRKVPSFRIRGKIIDVDSGQSAKNSMLQLLPSGGRPFFGFHPIQLRQDGTFETRGVVSGSYVIWGNRADGDAAISAREEVNVGDEDVDGVLVPFHKAVEIAGTIQFDGTPPREPGRFQVSLESSEWAGSRGDAADAQGIFTLKVSPGTYQINISRGANSYVKSIRYGEQDVTSGKITVTAGSAGALSIVMGTDVGELQGSVESEKGEPVAGASITVAPADALQDRTDLFVQLGTDPNGKFDYQDLAPGDYKVYAWDGTDQDVLESPELRKAFDGKAVSVSIQPGGHASVQLKLISAAEIEAERNKLP